MKNTKLFAMILLVICFAAGIFYFWDIILSFLLPAVLAYLLNPLVKWVMRKAGFKRRGPAVAIVLVTLAVLLILLVSLAVPPVFDQISGLIVDLQIYADNFDDFVYQVTDYMARLHIPEEVIQMVTDLVAQSDTYILSFAMSLLTSIIGLSLQIFDLIVGIIVLVYFMLDGHKLISDFIHFFPKPFGKKLENIFNKSDFIAKQYIRSRVILTSCMAVGVYIGLKIIGIEYALVFAILTFCLDFIPYFGSLIACVIEIFYALITGGLTQALIVAAFVIGMQQLEGNILSPKIEGGATGIHPITVLFALLAAEQVFGTLGMLISTPVAAILKTIFVEIFEYIVSKDKPATVLLLPDSKNIPRK